MITNLRKGRPNSPWCYDIEVQLEVIYYTEYIIKNSNQTLMINAGRLLCV